MKYYLVSNKKISKPSTKENVENAFSKLSRERIKEENIRILSEEEYNKEFVEPKENSTEEQTLPKKTFKDNALDVTENVITGMFPKTKKAMEEKAGVLKRIGAGISDVASYPARTLVALGESIGDRDFLTQQGMTSDERWDDGSYGTSLITDPMNIFGAGVVGKGVSIGSKAINQGLKGVAKLSGLGASEGAITGAADSFLSGDDVGDMAGSAAFGGIVGGTLGTVGALPIGLTRAKQWLNNARYNRGREIAEEAVNARRYGDQNWNKNPMNDEDIVEAWKREYELLSEYTKSDKSSLANKKEEVIKEAEQELNKSGFKKDSDYKTEESLKTEDDKELDRIFDKSDRIYGIKPGSEVSNSVALGEKQLQNSKDALKRDFERLSHNKNYVIPEELGLTKEDIFLLKRANNNEQLTQAEEVKVKTLRNLISEFIRDEEKLILDGIEKENNRLRSQYSFDNKPIESFDEFSHDWDFGDLSGYDKNHYSFPYKSDKEYTEGFREKAKNLLNERKEDLASIEDDIRWADVPRGNYFDDKDAVKIGKTYSSAEKDFYNNMADEVQKFIAKNQGDVRRNMKGEAYVTGEAKKYTNELIEPLFNSLANGQPLSSDAIIAISERFGKINSEELLDLLVDKLQTYKGFDNNAKNNIKTKLKRLGVYKKLSEAKAKATSKEGELKVSEFLKPIKFVIDLINKLFDESSIGVYLGKASKEISDKTPIDKRGFPYETKTNYQKGIGRVMGGGVGLGSYAAGNTELK